MRRRTLVVLFSAAIIGFGLTQFGDSEVEVLPEFTPTFVEVQTEALGLSAAEVEQLITVPLEADLLNGVAWVEEIRSRSVPGLSSIVLTFEPGTDLLRARQMVQERLTQAAGLPNVSRAPSMVQPLSSESRVMMIGLTSGQFSLVEMSVLTRWTIRPRLMGVTGVANVTVWGQRDRQLQVQVDPGRLQQFNITLLDIVKTTGNALWVSPLSYLEASTPGTGGFIDTPNQRISVQHVLAISTPEDLAAVTIEGAGDLRLGDVVTVVEDHQPLIGDAAVEGGAGLLLVIEKFPWGNTLEVTRGVEAALEELAPGLTGIQVNTELFRPATYIERSMNNIARSLLVGAVLAVVAMFGLFYAWRSALIALVAVVVSLVTAAAVLYVANTTINMMVLAGLVLALGLVIDDAVADVDLIRRRLAQRRDDRPAAAVILDTLPQSRGPLIYATIIVILATTPVLFMDGAAREFLPPVALTYALALIASIGVALVVTPAMSLLLLDGEHAAERRPSRALSRLGGWYDRALAVTVRTPGLALAGAVGIVIVGAALLPVLSRQFVPEFKQTDLLVRLEAAPGTSLPEMQRIVGQASDEVRSLPGVDDVGTHTGRAVLSDEIVNVNSSELWVRIDPDAPYGETVDSIRSVLRGYPGLAISDAISYLNERTNTVLGEDAADIVVRVYGQRLDVLEPLAEDVAGIVASVAGTADVHAILPAREPAIEIEVDLDRAARYHVKPGDVRRAAATLLSGIEVGSFFESQKVFEVVVWSTAETRNSVTSVENLLIDTPSGDVVRLADIADVRVASNVSQIERDAVSRFIDVAVSVRGRSAGEVESDIRDRLALVNLPFEYHVRMLTNQSDRSMNQRALLGVTIVVALGIFLLLQAAFESWRLAALLFVTVPVALVGGIVAIAVGGGTFSIGSAAGFVAVLGISMRHGLALIGRFDQLQLNEGVAFGPGLVLRGARERFAPATITTITVALALLPFVIFGDIAGLEVVRPLASVVIGGLVTSAAVSLFIVPGLYLRFARPASPRESLLSSAGEEA